MGWEDRSYYREGRGTSGGVLNWILSGSAPLFTAFGIRVRAHSSLVILAPLVLIFGFGGIGFTWQDRVAFVGALFLVVLLHEFGHCFTARWVGGHAEDILMSPLGGLAMASPPRRPLPTFLTIAGGPAVNVLICLVAGVYLVSIGFRVPLDLFNFSNPLSTGNYQRLGYIYYHYPYLVHIGQFVFQLFAVSWGLFLFNLLPMYPLDGGQMLQAILWPHVGYYKSMKFSAVTGMVGAGALAIVGIYSGSMLMVFIAISCFMTCFNLNQQLKYAGPGGIDAPDEVDYSASIYAKDPKPRRKRKGWFARRAATLEEERAEQQKIDAILAKVSAHGMNSLTWLEKRALRRATERQRKRDLEMARRMRM
jgi:Zn-dependent protease